MIPRAAQVPAVLGLAAFLLPVAPGLGRGQESGALKEATNAAARTVAEVKALVRLLRDQAGGCLTKVPGRGFIRIDVDRVMLVVRPGASLEKKLDKLLAEVERLQRALGDGTALPMPGGPARQLGVEEGAAHVNQRVFKIPIRIAPDRQADVRELLLYTSKDQGKTWEIYSRASPDARAFDFRVCR